MAKILIVDDDLVNAKVYANKLAAEGCGVVVAPDGNSAQKQITQKFDLILLDIMIPKMDGVALLGEIKKSVNRQTPVIVHTNLTGEEIKKQCMELGAKEFLLKVNLTPNQLVEKIKAYCGAKPKIKNQILKTHT